MTKFKTFFQDEFGRSLSFFLFLELSTLLLLVMAANDTFSGLLIDEEGADNCTIEFCNAWKLEKDFKNWSLSKSSRRDSILELDDFLVLISLMS